MLKQHQSREYEAQLTTPMEPCFPLTGETKCLLLLLQTSCKQFVRLTQLCLNTWYRVSNSVQSSFTTETETIRKTASCQRKQTERKKLSVLHWISNFPLKCPTCCPLQHDSHTVPSPKRQVKMKRIA